MSRPFRGRQTPGKASPLWPGSQRLRVSPASPMCCCRCSCEICEGRAQSRGLLIADSDVVVGLLAGEVAVLPASLNRSDGPLRFWVGVVSGREQKKSRAAGTRQSTASQVASPQSTANAVAQEHTRRNQGSSSSPVVQPTQMHHQQVANGRQNIQDYQLFFSFLLLLVSRRVAPSPLHSCTSELCSCRSLEATSGRLRLKAVGVLAGCHAHAA